MEGELGGDRTSGVLRRQPTIPTSAHCAPPPGLCGLLSQDWSHWLFVPVSQIGGERSSRLGLDPVYLNSPQTLARTGAQNPSMWWDRDFERLDGKKHTPRIC